MLDDEWSPARAGDGVESLPPGGRQMVDTAT